VSEPASGLARALSALARAGVDFVVVGVGGINFYARTPAQSFATLDLDALLRPAVENLRLALSVLDELGFEFEAGGEPFVDPTDPSVLARVISHGASLSALHRETGQIDLLTSISGFDYPEFAEDASGFEVGGVEIRVGRLTKLLRSKEASGRPKDLEFLRLYRSTLADEE
jgi:predicted nucleotidyltransferase